MFKKSRQRWDLLVIAAVTCIYIVSGWFLPKSVFWSPDEGAKLLQIGTLVWDGGVHYQPPPYVGQRLDPLYQFYPQYIIYARPMPNGDIYQNWPPWFAALSSLPLHYFGLSGLYMIPLASGLLIILLVGQISQKFQPQAAPLAMVMVALGSPIWFYSLLFWEHTLTVLLGLSALWQLLLAYETDGWYRRAYIVSLITLLGAATALRTEMLLFALALGWAWFCSLMVDNVHGAWLQHRLRGYRKYLLLVDGVGLAGLTLWVFEQYKLLQQYRLVGTHYHQLIEHGVIYFLQNFPTYLQVIWISQPIENGPDIPASLARLALVGIVLSGLTALLPQSRRLWIVMVGLLCTSFASIYVIILAQNYRAIHSFFLLAPYLVLSVLAVRPPRPHQQFSQTVIWMSALAYLLLGSLAVILRESDVGVQQLEWGPRYILIAYPLLTVCAAVGMYQLYEQMTTHSGAWLLTWLGGLLIFVGLLYQLRGLQELQQTKAVLLAQREMLATYETQPVVTDLFWLPAAFAPQYLKQEIYIVNRENTLPMWLDLAQSRAERFVYVSFTPFKFEALVSHEVQVIEHKTVYGLGFTQLEMIEVEK